MLYNLLSKKIHLAEIQELVAWLKGNNYYKKMLLDILLTDTGKREAINVAWVFTHLSDDELAFLNTYQSELTAIVMKSTCDTTRRLVMSLLHRLALDMNVEFLNYCFNTLNDKDISVGIRSLAIKISYQFCVAIPAMCAELQCLLQLLNTADLPSVQSAKNQTLKKINESLS